MSDKEAISVVKSLNSCFQASDPLERGTATDNSFCLVCDICWCRHNQRIKDHILIEEADLCTAEAVRENESCTLVTGLWNEAKGRMCDKQMVSHRCFLHYVYQAFSVESVSSHSSYVLFMHLVFHDRSEKECGKLILFFRVSITREWEKLWMLKSTILRQ